MRLNKKFKIYVELSRVMTVVVLSGLITACAHDAKPVEFYRLSADVGLNKTNKSVTNLKNVIVGLGPIKIPDYLNRSQMLVAISDNQYTLSEEHRWAEKLDQNILLALYKVLPEQLNTEHLIRYPWAQRQEVDYQVGIDILDLTVDAQGQSQLIAQWFIKSKDKPSIDKRFECRLSASTTDYAEMVKAQSQCLTQLGQVLAKTLNELM
jgi:Uncharacterized protein conserved in bacteria